MEAPTMSFVPDSALLKLVIYGLVAGTFYYIYQAVYNLYLSPVAHVPGPFWAKISAIPSCYYAAKGIRHIWLWQNFQMYGETIRVAPNTIVFKSPTAYRDIYNIKANVTRAKTYEIWQRTDRDINTLNTSDVQIHRNKRRLLNLVFTEKSLRSAETFIIDHVDRWNAILAEAGKSDNEGEPSNGWLSPVNIASWSDCLSFDIMGDLSFGVQFNTKEPGENRFRKVPEAIHAYMRFNYPITKSPLLPFLLWAKPKGLNSLLQAITPPDVKFYYNFIEESINKRQTALREAKEKGIVSGRAREDMFHYLCEARHPDHGGPAYTEDELLAEANLLIIAGSDTTSIQLSGFFFYITHYEHCYQKVVAEVRETFSSPTDIRQGTLLSSCIYLRACIDEAMRLTPPGPSELGRLVLPGGQMVDGDFYPEGVHVGASMWSSARHEVLGDPFVYRPERWLVDERTGVSEEDVHAVKAVTHPFSAGPFNCAGKNLAIMELLITIGRTLWRYDVRQAPGTTLGEGYTARGWGQRDPMQYMVQDFYTSGRDGPMLQLRPRELTVRSDEK